jgi:hypothetical protein
VGIKLPYTQKANPDSAHHQMKAVDPSWILHAGEVCFGAQKHEELPVYANGDCFYPF